MGLFKAEQEIGLKICLCTMHFGVMGGHGLWQCRACNEKAGDYQHRRCISHSVCLYPSYFYCVLDLVSLLTRRNNLMYISTAITPANSSAIFMTRERKLTNKCIREIRAPSQSQLLLIVHHLWSHSQKLSDAGDRTHGSQAPKS